MNECTPQNTTKLISNQVPSTNTDQLTKEHPGSKHLSGTKSYQSHSKADCLLPRKLNGQKTSA